MKQCLTVKYHKLIIFLGFQSAIVSKCLELSLCTYSIELGVKASFEGRHTILIRHATALSKKQIYPKMTKYKTYLSKNQKYCVILDSRLVKQVPHCHSPADLPASPHAAPFQFEDVPGKMG